MSGSLEQLPGLYRRTRFTDGALSVKRGHSGEYLIVDGNGITVAIAFANDRPLDEDARANAQLFATAHKLHAATHRLTFLLASVPLLISDTYARRQIQEAVEAARRVLAEAEGLTP